MSRVVGERFAQSVSVSLHDGRFREALAQELAKGRVELDQHQPRLRNAVLDQGFGNGSGAGPELDHRPGRIGIDVLRHGAGERLARRRDRADRERFFDPRADEANFVVEAYAVLSFEAADLRLDVTADLLLDPAERQFHLLLEMLFEQPHALFDVLADPLLHPAQRALDLALEARLKQADALLDVLPDLFEQLDRFFELFERLKGHRSRDQIIAGL